MSPGSICWQWSPFGALTTGELYEVLRLRQRVFVVEQGCAYDDADGLDPLAWHLLGWRGEPGDRRLIASARIFDRRPGGEGASGIEASIGRVVTDRAVRRTGVGRALMAEAIARCRSRSPGRPIRIHAQAYLRRFYEGFGFRSVSAPYLLDGIVHLDMVLPD